MDPQFIVVTGGPGVGKTTLLSALEKQGHVCVPEVARALIKEQVAAGGTAVPWLDRPAFCDLMVGRSLASESRLRARVLGSQLIFFDRGLPDIKAFRRLISIPEDPVLEKAIVSHRYFKTVFLLPPWEEIYSVDSERKQDFEEVVRTDRLMRQTYRDCGYEIEEVPRLKVQERAQFVLNRCPPRISREI